MTVTSARLRLPAPVGQWIFHSSRIREGELVSLAGPNLKVSGNPREKDGGLALDGPSDSLTYPWYTWRKWPEFPLQEFTVALVVRWDQKAPLLGLVGCIFATDDGLRGWALNVEQGSIVFRVATARGVVAVLADNVPVGKFVVLTATYDQTHVKLYVDGRLAAEEAAPLGTLTLNGRTPFAVGGWWQGDKTLGFSGVVRSLAIYGAALKPEEVLSLARVRPTELPSLPARLEPRNLEFVIAPTIQQVSTDSSTIVWESNGRAKGEVRFGEGDRLDRVQSSGAGRIHKVRLPGLKAGTTYSFQVRAVRPQGDSIASSKATFTTMPPPGQSFRFAIVGDTQDHPEVNKQVALGMLEKRPTFAMIVGDLVGAGWEKEQWTQDFFGSMRPLWAETPLFPVLGNHDRNAMLYYDLMALPAPAYRYAYRAGDAEFFVLDTERAVGPGSAQYRWLESALKRSPAKWKIVAHHYPPYSSDLDDYGTDLGDLSARELVPLYDRYQVDLVFSGHIHSYERTHPLRNGAVVKHGTTYIVIGGGGGDLEQFLPMPPGFSVYRKSAHHYGIVDVTPQALKLQAYDLSGQIFDTFEIRKE